MKIKFYSIQDLHDEVKDTPFSQGINKTVRMQFLKRTISSKTDVGALPIREHILTLTIRSGNDVLYYSQPFYKCIEYEIGNKQKKIDNAAEKLEAEVKETFKGWTIKKGVYEDEAQ